MVHPFAKSDRLILRYDHLWSNGAYLSSSGDCLAAFAAHEGVVEISDESGQPMLRIVDCRDGFRMKPSSLLPQMRPTHFWPRRRYALLDDCDETVGLIWPNSTLFASRWLIRLETKDERSTLRARTSLAQWNADHSRKDLVFGLEPTALGAVTVSVGWDGHYSAATTIVVDHLSSVQGPLRLLVIAAPLCLQLAGLTGLVTGLAGPGYGA